MKWSLDLTYKELKRKCVPVSLVDRDGLDLTYKELKPKIILCSEPKYTV